MLDPELFKDKYQTNYKQIHEESFLDSVHPDDREMFEDSEILTGKNVNGKVNKFNNFGKKNKGKKYNTIKQRMITSFNKFCDEKISSGEIDELWEKMFLSSKRGSFNFAKYFMDRAMGVEPENMNLKVDGDINFSFEPDEKSVKRIKDNKEDSEV